MNEKNVHTLLSALAYASVAKLCILPMQDVLGLDETTRMNHPGTVTDNWAWRMNEAHITEEIEKQLRRWVELYNR